MQMWRCLPGTTLLLNLLVLVMFKVCIIIMTHIQKKMIRGGSYNFSHIVGAGAVATNNCSSSIESPSGTWPTSEAVEQENVVPPLRGEHSLLQHALCKSYLGIVLCMANVWSWKNRNICQIQFPFSCEIKLHSVALRYLGA